MEIKRNKSTKVIVVAIAILLCLALAVGITGAFYQAQRRATGTVKMDKGIVIDYTGFGKTPNEGTWLRETTISFKLFEDADVQPGEKISLLGAGIKANASSVDFYARVKLSYEFYNGETKLDALPASFKASDLITTSATFFGSDWVDSGAGDGYYYYATGTTLNKFVSGGEYIDLFDTNARFIIEGADFTGAYPDGEGGGFVVDETTSINKIVVYLTLETLQGDADATAEGWKIIEEQDSMELTSTDYIIETTTNEETSEEITIYTPNDDYVLANPEYAFKFTIDDTAKTATITGPVGAPTSLTIPSKILLDGQNYDVIAIGSEAFVECDSLTSITLPSSLTSIGYYAFYGCTSLTEITIPSRVISIGNYALMYCTGLTSITVESGNAKYHSEGNCLIETASKTLIAGCKNSIIPTNGSVKSIGDMAFIYSGLTSITIPNSVTSIGTYAFYYCTSLTEITILGSITSVGDYAFHNCDSLQASITEDGISYLGNAINKYIVAWKVADNTLDSYTIKDGCKIIYDDCFSHCSSATEITIPNSVTSIGNIAFIGCHSLTSIIIPSSVTSIGDCAFEYCRGLTSITIPSSVTSIENNAFRDCSGLTSITVASGNTKYHSEGNCLIETASKTLILGCKNSIIPTDGSVTSIIEGAFYGCSGLTSITIPSSVTSIGGSVFEGCYGLTSITILSSLTSIGDSVFEGCRNLTSIIIPNSVTSIGDGAFRNCSGLTSITIPSGVTSIGWEAFYGCSRLTTVIIDSSTIAALESNFSNLLTNATTVYVKTGLAVGSYITGSFTKQGSSDKAGYDKYTKNA